MAIRVSESRTRLFVGEGNFSYTEALCKKHPGLAKRIVATDLEKNPKCRKCETTFGLDDLYEKEPVDSATSAMEQLAISSAEPSECGGCVERTTRISELKALGVWIKFGIDAASLKAKFPEKKFKHIHWNCPHDGENYKKQTLPPLVAQFFAECRKIQKPGGHVHMALAQPLGKEAWYQEYCYNIAEAAAKNGYTLVTKRKFDTARFPEYRHQMTTSSLAVDKCFREFVFRRRSDKTWVGIQKKALSLKELEIFQTHGAAEALQTDEKGKVRWGTSTGFVDGNQRLSYVCSTDNDSSDYSDTDDDEPAPAAAAGPSSQVEE